MTECTDSAATISLTSMFARYGITDAAISLSSAGKFLVLTDDLKLYCQLLADGIDAINFNHIRPIK
jgi:hypothetical protein